ncbi:L-ascorbate metabolism protein UlaG (beta-lactamase superfamily) [Paenibacillus phyllosphaerae]|uniref:L-ascorbate metabolism protein UlaG (Beta-lactamase superfamily) n=1 Tax=Paenibacillus phyllosphaerae TaxID=274593 RepID=A0A7W5AUP8_9BACL|nr:L-ascorbate metabolism protein UlaG (beta-lactamase superfamily) [Paenibacillus phyllosphaerae]
MRYANLNPAATTSSMKDLRRWRKERAGKMKHKDFSWVVPTAAAARAYKKDAANGEPSIVWVGHSTFLIRHSGLNIVTDPVWAGSMGFQKRLTKPGIAMNEMPKVDVILLSHSHYDHLHLPSVKALAGQTEATLIVPVGLAAMLRRKGYSSVIELQWWESATVGGAKFTFVPAQHWTRRTLTDTNRSHWGGFIIEDMTADRERQPEPTVYFAGDSGYFEGFKQIGERFDIDVALMPIGAYEPEWFMRMQHVSPEEALQAFLDVKAKVFVPMHYGAFALADDTPREAIDRLEAERARLGIEPERILTLALGEVLALGNAPRMQEQNRNEK